MTSDLELFTAFHVVISLIAILTGIVAVYGMMRNEAMNMWTALFLTTTTATSVTGFLFPFNGFTPAIAFGILSILVLIPTLLARYKFKLAGAWRSTYVIGSVFALYLNTFVLVVQSFQKIPMLNTLAPQGTEPPFGIAQGIVLLLFIAAGVVSLRKFRPTV